MEIDSVHANMSSEIFNANLIKDKVIYAMIKEGYISLEKGNEFSRNYTVILTKKSWFKNVYEKWFKSRDENGWYYDIIKFVGLSNGDESNDIELLNDINILTQMLKEAEKKEDFLLANRINNRINKLKGNV